MLWIGGEGMVTGSVDATDSRLWGREVEACLVVLEENGMWSVPGDGDQTSCLMSVHVALNLEREDMDMRGLQVRDGVRRKKIRRKYSSTCIVLEGMDMDVIPRNNFKSGWRAWKTGGRKSSKLLVRSCFSAD